MNVLVKTSLGYDGISAITMNYCRALSTKCHYTFFVIGCPDDVRKDYLDAITNFGWKIVYAPDSFKHFFKYKKTLENLLKKEKFDVFHINGNSSLMLIDYLICRKASKTTKVCVHSHNSNCTHRMLHFLMKPMFSLTKPIRIACSDLAGKWAYGRKNEFTILPNVIDYSLYYFKGKFRDELREKYNLQGKKIILHVGAFVAAKNHCYIGKILNDLFKKDEDTVAIFVGEGELKKETQERFSELGLSKRVMFVGNQTDTNKFYSLADVFILPSIYEGLPVVLLEAQVSGLYCVVSKNVSHQAKISDNVSYLGIDDCDVNAWVETIISKLDDGSRRRQFSGDDAFSSEVKAKQLLDLYLS